MTRSPQSFPLSGNGGALAAVRRLFGRPRQRTDAAAGSDVAFLHCTDMGWSAQILDPAAPDRPALRSEERDGEPGQGEDAVEAAFRLAADAFERQRVNVGRLYVLTDDPQVFYTDTRAEQFTAAAKTSPAVLRAFGAEQLNCAHAVFGFGAFGLKSGAPRPNGVAAFADAKRTGGCLGRLDRLALKVAALVPVADVLVHRALELGEAPYGALYIGGHTSQIVLANPRHGTVTVRVLPVGAMTLAEAVAKGSNIAFVEAVEVLRTRPMLDDVRLVEPAGDTAEITRSAADRMIGPILRRFLGDVEATLEYFDAQRVSGRPERLELFGAHERVKGLADFLAATLSAPAHASPATVLDLFRRLPPGEGVNLLQHTGPDLQIGQTSYRMQGDRLAPVSEAERAASRAAAANAARGRTVAPAGRRTARRGTAAGASGLQQLLARMRGAPAAAEGDAAPNTDRQYFLLFGLFCALLALLVVQGYGEMETRHQNAMARVSQMMDENMRLRRAVAGGERPSAASAAADKVLWTEKFLAIGRNMDKPMWLTDVFLATETRTVGGSSVLSKKLVLEGAVLPSTVGHILEISKFIGRLEEDAAGFMGDFREIRFHGATIDQAESDPIIRFGIEAWYDENKRVQSRMAGAPSGGALGDMQSKVRDRNQAIETVAPVPAR